MDYHALKRTELQALCKKHGIPANLKNVEMADRLSSLLKEEKPMKRGRSCFKNLSVNDEVDNGDEEMGGSKEPKKVKFSPQNETFIFEKTDPRELRLLGRKRRVIRKPEIEENPGSVVGNVCELGNVDDVEKPVGRNLRRRSIVGKSDVGLEPKLVEEPVARVSTRSSVVAKPDSLLDTEVVDNVEKPAERVSRRRSVVVKPDSLLDTEVVAVKKPIGRVSRRRSVVVKPNSLLDTEVVADNVEKPIGRVSRRKSVVVKPDSLLDTEVVADNVEIPVGRVSRRRSVVGKPDVILDTGIIDGNVEKPVERISRRKSVVMKPAAVLDSGIVGDVVKPVERVLRRRSVVVKRDTVSDIENVGNADKPVERMLRGRSVAVKSDTVSDNEIVEKNMGSPGNNTSVKDVLLVPCVEKQAKRSRKGQGMVGRGAAEEVDKPLDKEADHVGNKVVNRRQLRSTKMVAEISEGNDGVEVSERYNLAERGCERRSVRLSQKTETRGRKSPLKELKNDEKLDQAVAENVYEKSPGMVADVKKGKRVRKPTATSKPKGGREGLAEDIIEENGDNIKNSEIKDKKRKGTRTKNNSLDDAGSKKMKAVKKSSSQAKMSKVNTPASDLVVEDEKVDEMEAQCITKSEVIGCSMPATAGADYVQHKETILAILAPSQSLSENREQKIDEQCHATGNTTSAEKKTEISEEATGFSPNCSDTEETDIIDKTLENGVAAGQTPANDESTILQDSGKGGVDSSKLDDCPEETDIIDKALENAVAADRNPANDESLIVQNIGEGGVEVSKLEHFLEETYIVDKVLENTVAADQTPANGESSILQNSGEDGVECSKLDNCPEETNTIDEAFENAVAADQTLTNNESSILQNSGGGGIESFIQANRVGENSFNMDPVVNKNFDEETTSTTPSNLKEQYTGVGETDCHSDMEPNMLKGSGVSDTNGEQVLSSLGELIIGRDKCGEALSETKNAEDEMADPVAMIHKEQENASEQSEESPSKNENTVEYEVVDCALEILKEQENGCEESPSENKNAVENEVVCNATVIMKEQEPEFEESPPVNENAVDDEVVDNATVILKEHEPEFEESSPANEIAVDDEVVDNVAVSLKEQEPELEESPSENENAVDDEVTDNATVILKEQEPEFEESPSENENAVDDEVVDNAAVSLKEQEPEFDESPSENENAVDDEVVDNAAVIPKEQEHKFEESPSQNENAVGVAVDCTTVILKESDVKLTEQEEAVKLWSSCDIISPEIDKAMPEVYVDQHQSCHLISEENAVLGPEASMEVNAQSPNVVEGLVVSSNASSATLNKDMEEGKATETVTPLWNRGIDCSSSKAENSYLNQPSLKDDREASTNSLSTMNISSLFLLSQSDGDVGDFSSSMKKGEESCSETSRGDIGCLENSIKMNDSSKEDKAVTAEQIHEMNIMLEAAKDDCMINGNECKELKSEKTFSATKQATLNSCNEGETPVSIHERKWFQIADEGNLCSDVFGTINDNASECVSVSDKTKCLIQSLMDAAEDRKDACDEETKNSSVNLVNAEDRKRELSEASPAGDCVSCLDAGSAFTELSEQCEHNPQVDTISVADEQEFHLQHDKSAGQNSTPLTEIVSRLENLCDDYFAQSSDLTVTSGSNAEETTIRDLTCFANVECVDVNESDRYTSIKQVEESTCFNELQQVSGPDSDGVTNDAYKNDQEYECVAWNTEDLLALGGEIENSVSDPTMDSELMAAKDAENTDVDVNLYGENCGVTVETLNNEISKLSGDFRSISNEIFENSTVKKMIIPVSVPEFQVRDNESSADLKSNHSNSPVKPLDIQTPEASLAQDSSLSATQENTSLKVQIDEFTARASNVLGSAEKEVVTMAQETECIQEAEGLSICGNETPGTTIHKKLDEAPEQAFSQQIMSVGSIKKNFEYVSQELGSFELAAGECENISEKENLKCHNESVFVEVVEGGIAMHNSLDMSERSKSDVGEEMTEACSMVNFNPVHNVGNVEDGKSCSGYFEMAEKNGSPKRKSETCSLRDTVSELDYDAGSMTISCTPMNRDSKNHSSDAYAATIETASDSLQSSQNKCNNTLQNACFNDAEEFHSDEPMLLKDVKDDTVNSSGIVESDAKNSDDLPSKLATPAKASLLASTSEMHDEAESTADKDMVEYDNTTERELQAYNDDAQTLDSAKSSELRDGLDNRGFSVDREAYIFSLTPPLVNTSSASPMVQEFQSAFTLLNQEMDKGYGEGDYEPDVDDGKDQPQEQNYTPLMPYQQKDPAESATEPRTNKTAVLDSEDKNPKAESFVLTQSEIDLFWDEIDKEEADRKLQADALDVKFSVNEYEVADAEKTSVCTHQPAAVRFDNDSGKQNLQEGNADQVGDEKNCINAKETKNSMIKRKNTRSILIHGTPKKPSHLVHDMKENAAAPKRLQMVGATAVKPRRKVLEDISK